MIKVIKKFFTNSDGKFQPIYFWATIFLLFILTAIILKFINIKYISDTLVLGMMGFVSVIIGLYNINKKK